VWWLCVRAVRLRSSNLSGWSLQSWTSRLAASPSDVVYFDRDGAALLRVCGGAPQRRGGVGSFEVCDGFRAVLETLTERRMPEE
jgi:hypothetical protein